MTDSSSAKSALSSFGRTWRTQFSRPQRILVTRVVTDQVDPYVDFDKRKPNGTIRPISAPVPEWMEVLKIVQRDYLSAHELVSPQAFAYVSGRSAAQCASVHLNSKWIIRIDIRDFFHSIGEDRVYMILKKNDLGSESARILSRMATRRPAAPVPDWAVPLMKKARTLPGFGRARTRQGFLPQGSPTSGSLSNMVARPMDSALMELADANGWRFSRYADDIFLSCPHTTRRHPSSEVTLASVVKRAHQIVADNGFNPHTEKTRIMRKGNRQIILGVLVDGPTPRPSKDKVRLVNFHLHALAKHGDWDAHASQHGFSDAQALAEFLSGYLSYFRDINPHWTERLFAPYRQGFLSESFGKRVSASLTAPEEDTFASDERKEEEL